jgi:hypothetical protein
MAAQARENSPPTPDATRLVVEVHSTDDTDALAARALKRIVLSDRVWHPKQKYPFLHTTHALVSLQQPLVMLKDGACVCVRVCVYVCVCGYDLTHLSLSLSHPFTLTLFSFSVSFSVQSLHRVFHSRSPSNQQQR